MSKKALAFYIRLSSEDRDLRTNTLKNESDSVANQRLLLTDYYNAHEELHEYEIVEFCDDGVSGTHFNRPSFEELLNAAREQRIQGILVKDLSRFGRNFLEMGNYLELILPLYGTRFISVNDGFDSHDYLGVTGGMELALKNLINNMYSRDLSEKVKSALKTRKLRGEYLGGFAFYGYLRDPKDKKKLIVDEEVRDTIVRIYEWCVSGMSGSEIARKLNEMGVPSPLERRRSLGGYYNGVTKDAPSIWLKDGVNQVLHEERYTGKMISNTRKPLSIGKTSYVALPREEWIIVPGTHEAIISEELFQAATASMKSRIKAVNFNTAGNRSSNLLVCGYCGRKLRKNIAKDTTLVCPRSDSIKGSVCDNVHASQEKLESIVLGLLNLQCKTFLSKIEATASESDRKLKSLQNELSKKQAEIKRIQGEKPALYEKYRTKQISRDAFAERQIKNSETVELLTVQSEALREQISQLTSSIEALATKESAASQLKMLNMYDPKVIGHFVNKVRVFAGEQIELDMVISFECPEA